MIWAWMLRLAYAFVSERYYNLGMDALVAVVNAPYYGLGMDALVSVCSRNWTLLRFGHRCLG